MIAHAHLRVARPTDHMQEVIHFYCQGLGFQVIGSFQDHDGFDGVMLGHPGQQYHLEFTAKHGHSAGRASTQDNLLVFYLPNAGEWRRAVAQMIACGCQPAASFNPYWDVQGRTFEDPDGYRVVLQNAAWEENDEPLVGKLPKDQAAFDFSCSGDEPYTPGPDAWRQEHVPQGVITRYHWKSEHIYPGTQRDYWLYVPKQYDETRPACLMVFQDGHRYLDPQVNASTVFDNLIHSQEMPVTIGLFVNPGDKGPGSPIYGGSDNRSFEYDSLGDAYARFLIEELLPEIGKRYAITDDPAGRAICGHSSGGICAFTAAWERPDAFRKVVSHCGSFTNIRGGHNYPSLIRRAEAKPLRVFLQTGSKDLDVIYGNWPLANQDMAAALAYKEYDYQFVSGEGGHTLKHAGAIFPDTMRWLWSDVLKGS